MPILWHLIERKRCVGLLGNVHVAEKLHVIYA